MSIVITELNDDQIMVNHKIIDKDTGGNWIARVELTQQEHNAFQKHLKESGEGCND